MTDVIRADARFPPRVLDRLVELSPWFALLVLGPPWLASSDAGAVTAGLLATAALLAAGNELLVQRRPSSARVVASGLTAILVVGFVTRGDPAVLAAPPAVFALLSFGPAVLAVACWGLGRVAPVAVLLGALTVIATGSAAPVAIALGLHLLSVALLSGEVLRRLLLGAERRQRVLADLALVDPATGLANLRALRRDFERFRALARRQEAALALSRWRPEGPEGPAGSASSAAEFVYALETTLRDSDPLYALGDREFVALHFDLPGAGAPAARVREAYGDVAVTWALVGEGTLDEVLAEVRRPSARVLGDARVEVAN